LRFELSAYEPPPQIPDIPLLTGVLWPVGRIFIRNPVTVFTGKGPKVQRGKRPAPAETIPSEIIQFLVNFSFVGFCS